jgi:putative transcriptional regulator
MPHKIDANNRILDSVLDTARGLYSIGLINKEQMQEFDDLCAEARLNTPEYSSEQIRALRERWELSEAELAGKLNVSPATVRRWEVGKTRPQGPVLVLLDLMDRKGVEVLAR